MLIKNKKIRKFFILINVVLFVITILLTPLAYYSYNIDYYKTLFEKNGVFDIFNNSDVLDASENIIDFLKYRIDLDQKYSNVTVRYADENEDRALSFTDNEISHLYDVRSLLTGIFIIYYISILLFIIIMVMLVKRNIISIIYNTGLIFTISSILMIFFLVALYLMGKNFPVLFENFHMVFFPGGNYSFTCGSLIITLFPSGFFYDFFVRLMMASAIISIIFLLVGLFFVFILKFTNKYKREMI